MYEAGAVTTPGRTPPVWAFYALFAGIPVWWALGLSGFVWPVLALPMAGWLALRPSIRCPPGFALWLAFLAFVLASAVALDSGERLAAYVYRASLYASATVLLLFVYNVGPEHLPRRRAVAAVCVAWLSAVLGGFAGLLLPGVDFRSVTELVLPASVTSVPFVQSFVHPGLAEVSVLLGYDVPRPKAPFNYTNQWGANLALLTPFAFALMHVASRRLRLATGVLVAASLLPIVLSINRGLWLSLGAGVLYLAVRSAFRGDLRALSRVLALVAFVGVLLTVSPLGDVVQDRLDRPNTEGRATLYSSAAEVVRESPVIGFGAPIESESPNSPSVGTHGHFWTVLVSQGIVGLLLYVAWLARQLWATRRAGRDLLWLHVVVIIAVVQLPFYAALPAQLHILMVALAVVLREQPATGATVDDATGASSAASGTVRQVAA